MILFFLNDSKDVVREIGSSIVSIVISAETDFYEGKAMEEFLVFVATISFESDGFLHYVVGKITEPLIGERKHEDDLTSDGGFEVERENEYAEPVLICRCLLNALRVMCQLRCSSHSDKANIALEIIDRTAVDVEPSSLGDRFSVYYAGEVTKGFKDIKRIMEGI